MLSCRTGPQRVGASHGPPIGRHEILFATIGITNAKPNISHEVTAPLAVDPPGRANP